MSIANNAYILLYHRWEEIVPNTSPNAKTKQFFSHKYKSFSFMGQKLTVKTFLAVECLPGQNTAIN